MINSNILKAELITESKKSVSRFELNSHNENDYYSLGINHLSECSDFITNAKIAAYTEMYLEGSSNIINESLSGIFDKLKEFIKNIFSKAEATDASVKGSKSKLKTTTIEALRKYNLDKVMVTFEGYRYNIIAADTYESLEVNADDKLEDIKEKCMTYFRSGAKEKETLKMTFSEFEKYAETYNKIIEYDLVKSKQEALKTISVKAEKELTDVEVSKINTVATVFYTQMISAVKEYGLTVDRGIAAFKEIIKNKGKED